MCAFFALGLRGPRMPKKGLMIDGMIAPNQTRRRGLRVWHAAGTSGVLRVRATTTMDGD